MKIKSRLITKLKYLLSRHNDIAAGASIDATAYVNGSVIHGAARLDAGVSVDHSELYGKVSIGSNSKLTRAFVIAGEVRTGKSCKLHECYISGKVTIGDHSSAWGPNLDIVSLAEFPVSIGSYCSIARNVSIQSYNHNHKKASTYFMGQNIFNEAWANERVSKGGIAIGNDVWIGAHSVVLGGVSIGHGAVVAANSVVSKDVPPYAIVAGTPAKVIGSRFDEATVGKLLRLQWWDWTEAEIASRKDFFEHELTAEILDKYLADD